MKKYILLTLFIFTALHLSAVDLNGVKWISIEKTLTKPNQWICYRKAFTLEKAEKTAMLTISVDSKYWLWVNGKLVVFEGGLKRGPNPDDTYFDRLDIASYLKKGNNTIALLMWYWGKDGFCHKNSGSPGLLAKLQSGNREIISDASWKVKVHPAYGESQEPFPNYRLPESNIHFDARKDIPDWMKPEYDDSNWQQATIAGSYPCQPWNQIHPRPFPNWYDSGLTEYVSVERSFKSDTLIIKAKLPRNISVTPYFEIEANEGLFIDIRSDNYKGGSEYNVRAEYVTKKGKQSFEAFNYVNGHAIIYTIPPGVKVNKIAYRETRFNTEHVGSFECDDIFLNTLWQKSLNTMNLNMRDAIQDPDRERSQWWGDAVIVSGEILYSCDSNAHGLIQKAIRNLVDWQRKDSVLYSPVPAGSWARELPLQMLASIGKFGMWNYYLYTGDTETIRHAYPAVKRYLAKWKTDERNLVIHRPGDWDWGDWGENIDLPILDNAWYCLALEGAQNMASILGYKEDASVYHQQIKTIKQAVNTFYWNGKVYCSSDFQESPDDRANGLAVLAGFADSDKWKSIKTFLTDNFHASPYMEKYILEAFFVSGDVQGGLDRMKKRYKYMVDHPLTTLWEDWQIGGAGGGSINHGWAGGPLSLLSQYIAGISPLEAEWNKILIKPMLGNLKQVVCTVPTKTGTITATIKNQTGHLYSIDVTNTDNKIIHIAFPKDKIKQSLVINGRKYENNQLSRINQHSVKYLKSDESYHYFEIKNPTINISATH
ncbi:alpha-L-rhamnosidase-related protein [Parabacteroides faecis]|uniref:alpha-L-rhamnosidase-related protein n=1 Tax=Parabacteroides faecis TaxID=1217282 RepID=UPI0035210EEC